jgi:hypothetical protein
MKNLALFVFAVMTILSWSILFTMDRSGDVHASKRPYPPYIYINDFTQFYAVAKLAASPDRTRIYEPEIQDRSMNEVLKPLGLQTTAIDYGQNVPWFFCIVIPFTLLPLSAAFWAFNILGTIFGTTGLVLVCRYLKQLTWKQTILIVLGCYAALPAWFALQHGNTSYYLLGWACIHIFAFTKRRDILAGISLGMVAQKPQYAIPIAIAAVRYRRWKMLITAFLVQVVLWSAAAAIVGPHNIINYPHILFSTDTNSKLDGMYPLQMVSIRAVIAALVSEKASMPAACAIFFVSCGGLLYMWSRIKADNLYQQQWAWALTIMAMLVVSPHTSLYDVLLLSIPAIMTLPITRPEPLFAAPRIWSYMLMAYPFVSWILYFVEEHGSMIFQHWRLVSANIIMLITLTAAYLTQFAAKGSSKQNDG